MMHSKHERGQALLLIAFSMVALLAFAALAVDGGRVYSEQRRAQNAADSAAYAAASASIYGAPLADSLQAGLDQASFNAYFDDDEAANPDKLLDVMIYSPPVDGPYAGDDDYYQAKIRNHVDPVFSHIIYPAGLEVSVEAVARAREEGPITLGDAIRATSTGECNSMWVHGGATTVVNGGNVTSDSLKVGTPASCESLLVSGGGAPGDLALDINNGSLVSAGTQEYPSGEVDAVSFDPNADEIPELPSVPTPNCSHLPEFTGDINITGTQTLSPGRYPNGLRLGASADVTLRPGMYCMGGDFTMQGGRLEGIGVFIVMQGTAADPSTLSLGGNGEVQIYASKLMIDVDTPPNSWNGMLIYMETTNTGQIIMTGNNGSTYSGTIYAIGPTANPSSQYKCVILGTSDVLVVNSSIYCSTVELGGNRGVTLNYDEDQNFQLAPLIELVE